ncbi:hypothetical protein ACM66B_002966 [Microbotryomycetes sp. NB124-2]
MGQPYDQKGKRSDKEDQRLSSKATATIRNVKASEDQGRKLDSQTRKQGTNATPESIPLAIATIQTKGLRKASTQEQKAFYAAKLKQLDSLVPKPYAELDAATQELEKERAQKSLVALRVKASGEPSSGSEGKDDVSFTDEELVEHAVRKNTLAREALQREQKAFTNKLRALIESETAGPTVSSQSDRAAIPLQRMLDGESSSPRTKAPASERAQSRRRTETSLGSRRRARLNMRRKPLQTDQDTANVDSQGPPLHFWDHAVSSDSVTFESLHKTDVPVAKLSHGLTRVLFNPGVHFLRDPRSGVYNFPRQLEDLPPIDQFEFDKLPQYMTSSKDPLLVDLAKEAHKPFVGSTSSVVAMLCQIYFWISKGRRVNLNMLSATWQDMDNDFSMGQKLPTSVTLNLRDGVYAIDADKSMDATSDSNVLAEYGHMMEKLVTTDHDEFLRFLKSSDNPAPSEVDHKQAYQFSKTDRMVLRSQLDAHDTHLPNVTFDVKTRGSVAIRQDRLNHEEGSGYTVDKLHGPWESFEREYYDLIRSAFLKYQFQCRIGHMDGCFVAYHSTRRFFGFQYVPISDMDLALFGSTQTGDQVFRLSIGILETILEKATTCFPEQSIKVTFAAGQDSEDVLRVFVSPRDEEDPTELDGKSRMVLIEYKGWNYLDGDPVEQVVIDKPKKVDDSWIQPVWTIGFDMRVSPIHQESTGIDDEAAQTSDVGGVDRDETAVAIETAASTSEASNAEADPVQDETSTDDATPTHEEVIASDFVKKPPLKPLDPSQVFKLFRETREIQTMFSNLTLPTGISRNDVVAAADRLAKLKEERAEGSGSSGGEDEHERRPIELDPSDLAVRFPIKEGLDYRVRPSLIVRSLRAKARSGRKRMQEREAQEDPEAGYAEIESVLRQRQGVRRRLQQE